MPPPSSTCVVSQSGSQPVSQPTFTTSGRESLAFLSYVSTAFLSPGTHWCPRRHLQYNGIGFKHPFVLHPTGILACCCLWAVFCFWRSFDLHNVCLVSQACSIISQCFYSFLHKAASVNQVGTIKYLVTTVLNIIESCPKSLINMRGVKHCSSELNEDTLLQLY